MCNGIKGIVKHDNGIGYFCGIWSKTTYTPRMIFI